MLQRLREQVIGLLVVEALMQQQPPAHPQPGLRCRAVPPPAGTPRSLLRTAPGPRSLRPAAPDWRLRVSASKQCGCVVLPRRISRQLSDVGAAQQASRSPRARKAPHVVARNLISPAPPAPSRAAAARRSTAACTRLAPSLPSDTSSASIFCSSSSFFANRSRLAGSFIAACAAPIRTTVKLASSAPCLPSAAVTFTASPLPVSSKTACSVARRFWVS